MCLSVAARLRDGRGLACRSDVSRVCSGGLPIVPAGWSVRDIPAPGVGCGGLGEGRTRRRRDTGRGGAGPGPWYSRGGGRWGW